jgi:hypothetical protein
MEVNVQFHDLTALSSGKEHSVSSEKEAGWAPDSFQTWRGGGGRKCPLNNSDPHIRLTVSESIQLPVKIFSKVIGNDLEVYKYEGVAKSFRTESITK